MVPNAFVWEKGKMDITETMVVYDIKVGRYSQINEYMNLLNIKGNSLTFVQGHSDSTFSNFFSLETARPIEPKFHIVPSWDGGLKVSSNGLCHTTKISAMPIYGKTFKIFFRS